MKAPDKIYIEQKAVMYDIVNTEPCKPDDYEYISKDALLEWTKEKFESYTNICTRTSNDVDFGRMNAFSMIINKIESL